MPRKKSPARRKRGRPPKIPKSRAEDVEVLASLGLFNRDIAKFLDIRPETLTENFREEIAKGRAGANVRLARLMWRHADTDPATARHLSKQKHFLGWDERFDIDLNIGGDAIDEKIVEALAKLKPDQLFRVAEAAFDLDDAPEESRVSVGSPGSEFKN